MNFFLTLGPGDTNHLFWLKCTVRAISQLQVVVAAELAKCKSFMLKCLYVMGKVQPGELSCIWTSLVSFRQPLVSHIRCMGTPPRGITLKKCLPSHKGLLFKERIYWRANMDFHVRVNTLQNRVARQRGKYCSAGPHSAVGRAPDS